MPRAQESLARLIERHGLADARIADAFRKVDRADFVPEGMRFEAYVDRPVGLPENQTTSQPSLIARMIDVAKPRPTDRALEIGTGYGFQTALLAQLVAEVISIERWPSLAKTARANLRRAGIANAEVRVGDGWMGCPDAAPFDVIIVSAAADELPRSLEEQLAEGGRLVIPLAEPSGDNVYLFQKKGDRLKRLRLVTPARFVPLVHRGAAD
jgi:protein-L-isoaspartate(D-aspartate) O-methyltransferase